MLRTTDVEVKLSGSELLLRELLLFTVHGLTLQRKGRVSTWIYWLLVTFCAWIPHSHKVMRSDALSRRPLKWYAHAFSPRQSPKVIRFDVFPLQSPKVMRSNACQDAAEYFCASINILRPFSGRPPAASGRAHSHSLHAGSSCRLRTLYRLLALYFIFHVAMDWLTPWLFPSIIILLYCMLYYVVSSSLL